MKNEKCKKTQNTCINERKEPKNKWNEKEITKLKKMWTMKKCTKNTKYMHKWAKRNQK